jgi:DNA-binding beta-propeller fold protein YncE
MTRAHLKFAALGTALLAMAVLGGCASQAVRGELHLGMDDAPEGKRLLWPQPPEVPRYLYVGTLTGEQNFRAGAGSRSGLSSVLRWIAGLGSEDRKPVVLQRPAAVIGDEAGRVYVADVSRQAVFVFDEKAGELLQWEQAAGPLNFVAPAGLALGPDGSLLVADAGLALVARLDHQGKPIGVIGRGNLQRPTGVARDAQRHRIYVADTYAHVIKVFDDDGRLLDTIGSRGDGLGQFNFPTHLAFAGDRLYVTDTMNNRVVAIPGGDDGCRSGAMRRIGTRGLALGDLVRPKGVGVDGEGNVYVVESYYDTLLVYSHDGDFLLPIGGSGTATGRFFLPSGVWVDARNRVYVTDMFNGRVVLFQFLGGNDAAR